MKKIDRSKLEIKKSNVLKQWAKQYPSVTRWIAKLQRKEHSAYYLYLFCEWLELTPPELLKLKENPENTEAEELLDTFAAEDVGVTESDKFNTSIAVRSFFKHNYKDLASAAGVSGYEHKRPYWKPNKQDLRKLYRFCTNPRDRSILTLLCSTAIAKETLSSLKWKHLEPNWEKQKIPHISLPPTLIKGHGQGKYKGVRQETFLTPEAKRDLLEYKQWMEQKLDRSFTQEENVYFTLDQPYKALSYKGIGRIFTDLSKNSDIKFSPHDARRYVETGLEEARIPTNWMKKIKGRKVRGEESPYSRPSVEKLRRFYAEAVSKLQFLTPEKDRKEEQIQQALISIRVARPDLKEKDFKRIGAILRRKHIRAITLKEVGEALEELGKSIPVIDIEENEDCQRVIEENELAGYLAKGWRVEAVLPSGRIVIDNH